VVPSLCSIGLQLFFMQFASEELVPLTSRLLSASNPDPPVASWSFLHLPFKVRTHLQVFHVLGLEVLQLDVLHTEIVIFVLVIVFCLGGMSHGC
jgi:hypothetical protein